MLDDKYNYLEPIDKKINEFLSIAYCSTSYDGKLCIGYRNKKSKSILPLSYVKLSNLNQFISEFRISDKVDYYITANTFKDYVRRKTHLFSLNNIVIDIDNHFDTCKYDLNNMIDTFIMRLQEFNSVNSIVNPNFIIKSGRGLQLWYSLNPNHIKMNWLYCIVAEGLRTQIKYLLEEFPSELSELKLDNTASKNMNGYFRLPLTYNTKVNSKTDFICLNSHQYDLKELYKIVLTINKDLPNDIQTDTIKTPALNGEIFTYRRSLKIINMIYELQSNRNINIDNDGNIHENRQRLCFTLASFLSGIYSKEDSLGILSSFNQNFKIPLPTEKIQYLNNYVTSENITDSKTQKKKTNWRNKTLIEFLELTEEEQIKYKIFENKGDFIFDKRKCKSNATRDEESRLKRESRNDKVWILYKDGKSKSEISRELHISRPTINSILKLMTGL